VTRYAEGEVVTGPDFGMGADRAERMGGRSDVDGCAGHLRLPVPANCPGAVACYNNGLSPVEGIQREIESGRPHVTSSSRIWAHMLPALPSRGVRMNWPGHHFEPAMRGMSCSVTAGDSRKSAIAICVHVRCSDPGRHGFGAPPVASQGQAAPLPSRKRRLTRFAGDCKDLACRRRFTSAKRTALIASPSGTLPRANCAALPCCSEMARLAPPLLDGGRRRPRTYSCVPFVEDEIG